MGINLAPLPNGIQLVNTGLTPNDRQGDPLPVAFEKINQNFRLVITKNEDQFPGPVTFQQTLVVMGPATLNQAVAFNQNATANAVFRFNGHVDFKSTATFDGPVIFNNTVVLKQSVTFDATASFDSPVTFSGIVTMTGPVNLPNSVIKPENLLAINTPTNDLFLGYNAANGRFAWRPAPAGGSGSGGGLTSVGIENINASGVGPNLFLRVNPQGNGLVWSALGTGGLINVNLGDINANAAAPTRVLSVAPDGASLLWVDIAEQQAVTYQNMQEMILNQSEAIRTGGRNTALVQNQSGLRVFNYLLPLGVASNVEGEAIPDATSPTGTEQSFLLDIVSLPLPSAIATQNYKARLELTNGLAPFYWTLVGDVPDYVSLPTVTTRGVNTLTANFPAAGRADFSIEVMDSSTPPQRVTRQVSILVNTAPPALTILPDVVPQVVAGTVVNLELEAINGTGNCTWALTSGSLPTGLVLNTTTTASKTTISGTPTAEGLFQFTVSVTRSSTTATRTYELQVRPVEIPPLQILTAATLDQAVRNRPYEVALGISGGKPPYYFQIVNDAFPPGLSFSDNFTPFSQTKLFGVPTTAATNNFTLKVTDSSPNPKVETKAMTLEVINIPSNLRLLTRALPAAAQGQGYVAYISTSSGTGPYTWSVSSGNLPPGIQLHGGDSDYTFLRGIPTTTGNFTFTLRVTDSTTATSEATLTLSVQSPTLVLAPNRPFRETYVVAYQGVPFRLGVAFDHTLSPNNPPYRFYIYCSINGVTRYGNATVNGLSLSQPLHRHNPTTFAGPEFYIEGTPQAPMVMRYQFSGYKYSSPTYYPYVSIGTPSLTIEVLPASALSTAVFLTSSLPLAYPSETWLAEIQANGTTVVWTSVTGLPSWISYMPRGNVLRLYSVVQANIPSGTVYTAVVNAVVDGNTVTRTYPIIIA